MIRPLGDTPSRGRRFDGPGLAVGPHDVQVAACVEPNLPVPFVNLVVMPGAQWDQLPEIGSPAVVPEGDVVDLTVVEWDITPRTRCVYGSQGRPLGGGCRAPGSADVEG